MRVGQIVYAMYPIGSEENMLKDAKQECLRQIADGHSEPEQMLALAKAYRALREAESNEQG
jgi:hypothetical protein